MTASLPLSRRLAVHLRERFHFWEHFQRHPTQPLELGRQLDLGGSGRITFGGCRYHHGDDKSKQQSKPTTRRPGTAADTNCIAAYRP